MNNVNTFDNNAVRQISETVRTVQGKQKGVIPSKGNLQRSMKARITATIDDPGDPGTPLEFEFEAEQVSWSGSSWVAIPNGFEWDDTKPLYVDSGGVVGDVLTADPVSNGANSTIWLALKSAGGGSALTWIKTDASSTSGSGTGTVYAYRGSLTPLQAGDPLEDIVVNWSAPDVTSKGTISAGSWFCCDLVGATYYPINIPVVL
jgi:hypothetical protein